MATLPQIMLNFNRQIKVNNSGCRLFTLFGERIKTLHVFCIFY